MKEKVNFSSILEKIRDIMNSPSNKNEKLRGICELLRDSTPYYNWVGLYSSNIWSSNWDYSSFKFTFKSTN